MRETLVISQLGARGEGVAQSADGRVFVPYAVPGDRILAEVEGERGRILELLKPGPDRVAPFCTYFETCGGCAVQTVAPRAYAEWKRGLVVEALRHAGVDAPVEALVDAHGDGRRRATFHVRFEQGATAVGFMKTRAHEVVAIDACPLLSPAMAGALPAARALAQDLARLGKPLDILATATETGLDVDLRGAGALAEPLRQRLIASAQKLSLARLSNHGERLVEIAEPRLTMGRASLAPPPGAFLQATEAGERALAQAVRAGAEGARRVADLFAGVGTFALRLAESASVRAIEADEASLAALAKAARAAPGLRPIATETRDLFRRPLAGIELDGFDVIVFDPPRAGATAQAEALARSSAPRVLAVSCAPGTFARDAATLVGGGYHIEKITPFDQFRGSAHVEVVAVFRRAPARRSPRPLLS